MPYQHHEVSSTRFCPQFFFAPSDRQFLSSFFRRHMKAAQRHSLQVNCNICCDGAAQSWKLVVGASCSSQSSSRRSEASRSLVNKRDPDFFFFVMFVSRGSLGTGREVHWTLDTDSTLFYWLFIFK